MTYNWQQPGWPDFRYTLYEIEDLLFNFAEQTGHVSGVLHTLPEDVQAEAIIDTMVAEAIKTSEIEGEYLSRQDVISSIRNHLGLKATKLLRGSITLRIPSWKHRFRRNSLLISS